MIQKRLKDLLPSLSSPDLSIREIQYDSRKVQEGDLFFAVPGFKEDGAKYLGPAFEKGAVAAIVKSGTKIPTEFADRCFEVENVRRALAEASAAYYDFPAQKLKLIGVTGTKGKTSSTYLLESILKAAGKKPALLGGVVCRHPGGSKEAYRTTMESLELQKFLAEALAHGADSAVMEVSSHALGLDRVWGCQFQGVLFTNLTEDHLDFYGNMEAYFTDKKLLFQAPYRKESTVAATNLDSPYGVRLAKECPGRWVTYGYSQGDVRVIKADASDRGAKIRFSLPGEESIEVPTQLVGAFNYVNIAGAVGLAFGLGFSKETIAKGVSQLPPVPGRVERVETSLPFSVFVDFAHMGHALENVLQVLRPLCKGKLIAVFGAGGDRDPARRTQLGSVSARLADFTVITSDNPRTEDPLKIIDAVKSAFLAAGGKNYVVEPDRRNAIRYALEQAKAGDIVCLAGKGHETGQIIGTQTFPFDDREEAAIILRELERNHSGG